MIKNARAAEETREDHFAAAGFACDVLHQVVRDDAENRTQLENVPAQLAQNRHRGAFADHGIAFPRDRFDERRFSATIWPEDRHVFTGINPQAEVIEGDIVAANDAHIFQIHHSRFHDVSKALQTIENAAFAYTRFDIFPD